MALELVTVPANMVGAFGDNVTKEKVTAVVRDLEQSPIWPILMTAFPAKQSSRCSVRVAPEIKQLLGGTCLPEATVLSLAVRLALHDGKLSRPSDRSRVTETSVEAAPIAAMEFSQAPTQIQGA